MNQSQSQSQSQGVIDPPFLSRSRLGTLMMNPSHGAAQSRMMVRNYGLWPPPQTPVEAMIYQNVTKQQGYGVSKPRNWKGKDKRKPLKSGGRGTGGSAAAAVAVAVGVTGGYKKPNLNELKNQNRIKPRKFHPNKRNNRFAPYAPRNTTSFLIRAKRSGGIASLVSPCVATPAVLPTPIFSPSTELLGDTAKEEWGVECYGSMKGLIRLRSPGNEEEQVQEELEVEEGEGEGGGSSESDVEEHLEVERRLDQDLSRFEMVYPNNGGDHHNVLENRVNDQDNHIAQLEEENLMLKERLFLMDRELGDVRRRLQFLERQKNPFVEIINEEEEEEVVVVEEECGENEFVKEDEEDEASVAENVVVDKLCEFRSIHVVEDGACMDTMALSQCQEEEEAAAAAAEEQKQSRDGAAAVAAADALADNNNIGHQ